MVFFLSGHAVKGSGFKHGTCFCDGFEKKKKTRKSCHATHIQYCTLNITTHKCTYIAIYTKERKLYTSTFERIVLKTKAHIA